MTDGSLACLRQLKKEEARGNAKDATKIGQLNEHLNMVVRFFQMVLDMALCSLFPGACYQRKKTALDMISLLYEMLMSAGSRSYSVKGGGSGE